MEHPRSGHWSTSVRTHLPRQSGDGPDQSRRGSRHHVSSGWRVVWTCARTSLSGVRPVLRSSTTVGSSALLRTGCGNPCQPSQPAPQVSAHCATQRIAGEANSEQSPWAGAPERHRRPALQFCGSSARPRSPARYPRDPSPRRTIESHPRSALSCTPPLSPARGARESARPCRSIE